jgi:peptide/nickel transport system substrate-binding protein
VRIFESSSGLAETVCRRIRLRALACFALAVGVALPAPFCEANAAESHALAMHGAPALSPGFTHMPYANPDAPKGGRLVWGVLGTFDSLNPLIVRGLAVQQMRGYVVESLMARGNDEAFTLYGQLAKSVETDDARSYVTFHLDPKARFADGTPVTAEDVLFSWALLRDRGRPNLRQYYSKVAKAEAPDPLTARFDFGDVNDRELPLILGLMPVLPRHAIDPETFEETTMTGPLGSGPYRVTAVKPGASVTLTRNPDYWGRDLPVSRGLWNFDEIRLDYYRESNGGVQARPIRLSCRERTAALARRLQFSGGPQRRGDPRYHQDRDAAAVGIPGVQHATTGVFRRPCAAGADAAFRFRVDQPQLLFRTLCARRRLLRRIRTISLYPPGG